MTDSSESLSDYVRRVHETTQKYLRGLISENEKLAELIRSLEKELDRERSDRLNLETRIAAIDAERRAYLERYLDVEEQNANVSNLYVATLRLHRSIGHDDVIAAIQEIVVNLIGSEELAIFELGPGAAALRLSSSCGLDSRIPDMVPLGVGVIGLCAESGHSYTASSPPMTSGSEALPYENDLSACVPLMVEGVVTGAVAVFRLLKHKPKLEPIDHELLGLLSTHAAMALYCAGFVESRGGRKSLHVRAASEMPPDRDGE